MQKQIILVVSEPMNYYRPVIDRGEIYTNAFNAQSYFISGKMG